MAIDKEQILKILASLREDPDALIAIIVRQAGQIDQLQEQVNALTTRLCELEEQGPRSVAPFRIPEKKRSLSPRGPGREAGHTASYRKAPAPTEEIRVPLLHCPCCGAPVRGAQALEQVIEEIAPIRPRVVKLTTYKAICPRCGPVRSSHPLQVSQAVGAAGAHLGPGALSLICRLQYQWHLSKRKSCQILKQLFGISLSPGGLVGATHRLGERLVPEYMALFQKAREAEALYSDETGWYVGRPGYSLWVFAHEALTLYRVVSSRNRQELLRILGADFAGVLVSDCLSVYDTATALQHKCYSHHLKAISKAIEQHPQQGVGFLNEVKMLLKSAMALKELKTQMDPTIYQKRCDHLKQSAERLLHMPRGQPQEETIRMRLFKQRDHLFTFLDYAAVDATNNLAERQLRPAVIARKLSCGNRTDRGAQTWQTLASLAATCQQNGRDLAELITNALARTLLPEPTR